MAEINTEKLTGNLDLSKIPFRTTPTRSYRGKSTPRQRNYIDLLRQKDSRVTFTYQMFLLNLSNHFGRRIRDLVDLTKQEADKVIEDMTNKGSEGFSLRK